MELTIGQMHDAVTACAALEDTEIKLTGETILSIAININAMKPFATAYEQTRARVLADTIKQQSTEKISNQEIESIFVAEDNKLRAAVEKVELRTIDIKSLDLDNNPKIRPVTIARLIPLLTGV